MGRAWANRAFVVILAMAIGFLLVTAAAILIGFSQIGKLQLERAAAGKRLAEMEATLQQDDPTELKARAEELSQALVALDLELPPPAYVPTLLDQIELLALNTDNDIKETRPGEYRKGEIVSAAGAPAEGQDQGGGQGEKGAGGSEGGAKTGGDKGEEQKPKAGQRYNELDIQCRSLGSYRSTFEFIRRLGSMRKMILVKNITFRKNQGNVLRADHGYEGDVMMEMTACVLEPLGKEFPGLLGPLQVR
jgi:Tfp pilus assembly protein PilO